MVSVDTITWLHENCIDNQTILLIQVLKCEYFPASLLLCDSKLNIFGLQTYEDVKLRTTFAQKNTFLLTLCLFKSPPPE